jgi:tetratricopeptide (TPR) repeat protein
MFHLVHGVASTVLLAALAFSAQAPLAAEDAVAAIARGLDAGEASAVVLAEETAARFPDNATVLMWLGHAYRKTGEFTAAAGAYRRAANLAPEHPEVLMGQAALREAVGDVGTALALYEHIVDISPGFAAAWRAAGLSHMQTGNHARAADYFKRYVQFAPDDQDVLYLYGVALYFGGRHDDAIVTLQDAIVRYPDLVSVKYALGVVLADRPANHGEALILLRAAAEADFERPEATYLIGRINADRGDLDAAVTAFEATIRMAPDHLDAHYRLATALGRLGRRDEAAPIMQRFSELQQELNASEAYDKQLKATRNELAAALRARDGAAATAAVDVLLGLAPEDPDVLVTAAKVWISGGREAAAFDALEAASQIAPDNWEANYLYGLLLGRRERFADALGPLRRSLAANPLFAETHVVVGNVLMELGAPADAIASYLAAIDLEADNPGYWLNLATAYGELGRVDRQRQANAEYQRLLEAQTSTR